MKFQNNGDSSCRYDNILKNTIGQIWAFVSCYKIAPIQNEKTNLAQILTLNEITVVGVLGIQTHGSRMVGTEISTELWWHPIKEFRVYCIRARKPYHPSHRFSFIGKSENLLANKRHFPINIKAETYQWPIEKLLKCDAVIFWEIS